MADAMEMMILSILGPALHCDWNLPPWQQALLTSVIINLSINQNVLIRNNVLTQGQSW